MEGAVRRLDRASEGRKGYREREREREGCWLPEGLMASGPVTVSGVRFQSDVQRPVKSSGAEAEAG